jgi:putative copper resistance protein D
MPFPLRILYVFLAVPQNAFLAIALLGAGHVLYPHYAFAIRPWGADALTDQRAGGEVMWIAGGLVMFLAMLTAVAAWLAAEQRAGEGPAACLDAAAAEHPA